MFANVVQSLASNSLPVNWFDAVVILVLGFGLFRGRKNGMSKEILPLFQWLAVVFVSGLFYSMVAQLLVQWTGLDPLISYLLGYVILALAVIFVFSLIKRTVGLRLFGSNIFGSAEYYLGMPSGLVRFACILVFALAFLNARHFTASQIEASNNYQDRWYGAHFFPNLYNVQDQVFKQSFTGPYIKDYLGVLLIQPTTSGNSGNQAVEDDQPAE
ncbi:MAG TPA: CvpA family protein [Candidatus Saccharimonadales bacterium]|nr:CvpA family protein [Candidatus Saccharimonadales bacterium]